MPVPIPASACCARSDDPSAIRAAFDEHGFVVFRGFLPPAEASAALAAIAEFTGAELPATVAAGTLPAADVFYDDAGVPGTMKQIQHLDGHSAYFHDVMHEQLAPICEAALGEPVRGENMQYFNKPGTGSYAGSATVDGSRPTPPHQDGYYFMIEPQQAVTMWLALEDADDANGCLRYVRGSKQRGMRPHSFSGVMGFSQTISDYDESASGDGAEEMLMAAKAGDLIIHHSLMIHRAPPNGCAERSRRAVGAIFYGKSAKLDQAKYDDRQLEIRAREKSIKGQ